MLTAKGIAALTEQPRQVARSAPGDPALGWLDALSGTWKTADRGWNMIALPFAASMGAPSVPAGGAVPAGVPFHSGLTG